MATAILMFMATCGTGTLAIIYTMKDANIPTVRTALILKVWGIALLMAMPLSMAAHFAGAR